MQIRNLLVNHLSEPLGIPAERPLFSFLSDGEEPLTARLFSEDRETPDFEMPVSRREASGFRFPGDLRTGTRYRFRVSSPSGEAETFFETAGEFSASFITPEDETLTAPVMVCRFRLPASPVRRARLSVTGLGLYRACLNGKRVGDAWLTPGINDYDAYLRYQTYDVTGETLAGEENLLAVTLGDGWYRGRYGIDKPVENGGRVWGTRYLLAAVLTVTFADGKTVTVRTGRDWQCLHSGCLFNSIYDGEGWDARAASSVPVCGVRETEVPYRPEPDGGVPIRSVGTLRPTLYRSPTGERILDFGENFAGVVRVRGKYPAGTRLRLLHGEALQDGCFSQANLRTARAEVLLICDGNEFVFEPMFTYFGFRYVLVEGIPEVDPADFEGVILSSVTGQTGVCRTGDERLNRLLANTFRGQRSNFMDIPTDCPQRDERLGWTADAQVFAGTACYQSDCYAFYRKFLRDLREEQVRYYHGDLPMYAPSLCGEAGAGGAIWADAATILPWRLYEEYGDLELLRGQYPMMRDYAGVLFARDSEEGNRGLITQGFTFGDWLAQDGVSPQSMKGGTDDAFLLSAYYLHSVELCYRAAKALCLSEDAALFLSRAEKIRSAILTEFFTGSGRLSVPTQTAYAVCAEFGIWKDRGMLTEGFRRRLASDFYRLKTGFCGTPFLLPALFSCGMDEDAYRILFCRECPGWFYAVDLGATTVWERWNSLLPNRRFSGTMMNSLNHYAYGSVCEAVYKKIAGLSREGIGWHRARIEPHPNWRLPWVDFRFASPAGEYRSAWEILSDGTLRLGVRIPAGCSARLCPPDGSGEREIGAGEYFFDVRPTSDLLHPFGAETPLMDLLADGEADELFAKSLPRAYAVVTGENPEFRISPVRFLGTVAMFGVSPHELEKFVSALRQIRPELPGRMNKKEPAGEK